MTLLGLKLPTDPRWVKIAEKNLEEILTDHAYCEQKAASSAISLIVKYPECHELVKEMAAIAQEEMNHFERVYDKIKARKLELGRERKDEYVHDLLAFTKRNGSKEEVLVDKLLVCAMIEARSCERFKILSEEIEDADLKDFYRELMISEAGHYRTFLGLAKKYGKGVDVQSRWKAFLEHEGEIIQNYGKSEKMHG